MNPSLIFKIHRKHNIHYILYAILIFHPSISFSQSANKRWGSEAAGVYTPIALTFIYSSAISACNGVLQALTPQNSYDEYGRIFAVKTLVFTGMRPNGPDEYICDLEETVTWKIPDTKPPETRYAFTNVYYRGCGIDQRFMPDGTCARVVDFNRRDAAPEYCSGVGNPIFPLSGTKREDVNLGITIGGLNLSLTYNTNKKALSDDDADIYRPLSLVSDLWNFSANRRIRIVNAPEGSTNSNLGGATAYRGNGTVVSFKRNATGQFEADIGENDTLISLGSGGFRYLDSRNLSIETYNSLGVLQNLTKSNGKYVDFYYSNLFTSSSIAPASGYLISMTDKFGRTINLKYLLPSGADPLTGALLSEIVLPSNISNRIIYDATYNLSKVIWTDSTSRQFLYGALDLPWALTGLVDELGQTYATFGYDQAGVAISTQHIGGVDKYTSSYSISPSIHTSEIFDNTNKILYRWHDWVAPSGLEIIVPTGGVTALGAVNVNGRVRTVSKSQPAGSGCAASTSAMSYDANGNIASRDDFNGNRVCYVSDLSRNLESVRVEGLSNTATCSTYTAANATLPAGSRKVSTVWHPDWRLETKVAEPGRLTTKVYNGQPDPFNGNSIASCAPAGALLPDGKPIAVLCKQVEQATTDTDGHFGLSATLQAGVPNRQRSWSYNQYGQVLTEVDPLNNTTTYAYYTTTSFTGADPNAVGRTIGDLQSVTNALGQVTNYTQYNKSGQVLQMSDANGVVTTNTYDLRQRLLSTSVAGQTTSYSYDPVGQLTKVTQPDASWVGYEYDAAHRLNAVKDNLGNRIEYTLDNAGNRTAEAVKDPGGALKRTLARSFDALGRVQQTTGRE